MIIRNILILLYLASSASSFLVAPPLVRSSLKYTSHSLQVSLSESGSEIENSESSDAAKEIELSGSSSDVVESLQVTSEATEKNPEEKAPSSDVVRHTIYVGNLPYCKQKAVCCYRILIGRKSNDNRMIFNLQR
jgi:hypothetical protein